jgi:hypothetical protein
MQFHREAALRGRFEHPFCLSRRERDPFAERIDGVDQTLRPQHRHHAQHLSDVVVRTLREFRWQRMRAQERRADLQRRVPRQRARHAQALAFVFQRQAIARLDLDRRHAFLHQGAQPRQALCQQLGFGRGAGRGDGGCDAAARARDLLIARTMQAQLEFAGAIPGIDQVRVAVDQPRRDKRATGVVVFSGGCVPARRKFAARTDPCELVAFDHDRGVFDQAIRLRSIRGHRRRAAMRPELNGHGAISIHNASPARRSGVSRSSMRHAKVPAASRKASPPPSSVAPASSA